MTDHTFTCDLTPRGISSCVLLDGSDISSLLRGIVVRASIDEATEIELIPAPGAAFITLTVRLPEARIVIYEPKPDDRAEGFA